MSRRPPPPSSPTQNTADEAQYRLALQCYEQGKHDEALTICERMATRPALQGPACLLMGCIYLLREQYPSAEAALQTAAQKLDSAVAWFNLALTLVTVGKPEQAEQAYRKALQRDPKQHKAWNNLGTLLRNNRNREQFQQAIECYQHALELQPNDAIAHSNLAHAYSNHGEKELAEKHYRIAWELEPDHLTYMTNWALQRGALADWSHNGPQPAQIVAAIEHDETGVPVTPFPLLAWPEATPDVQRDAAVRYARTRWRYELSQPPLVNQVADVRGRRIRVGYLSADVRDHPVTYLMTDVIAHHDRERFEVFLYAYGPETEDQARQALRQAAEHFTSVSALSDRAAAEKIRADGIDLLVNLTGYTSISRVGITALRPAAVIASWLGYIGTLGEPRLADYVIGDAIATPPERASDFSESLALMPHCFQPNQALTAAAMPVPTRSAEGLPENAFVFCSFNQCYKLTPMLWDDWCRILERTGNSVLWLFPMPSTACDNLRREAAQRGIDPRRLVFAKQLPLPEHQARIALADLALDTWPYNSGATGSDVLRAGVPLLTLQGETFVGRMGASLLHCLGLDELIAPDRAAYIDLAVTLATDPARLQAIKTALTARLPGSPLFNPQRFARDLERLFQAMIEQRARGESGVVRV